MTLIREYETSSGQQLNTHKSAFYVGSKAAHRARAIAAITGISQKQFPFNYLGVQIFNGKMKAFILRAFC